MERINLLVSDLDGTLLGDERALDAFVMWYVEARERLRLVYSSGRLLESICQSIEEWQLPEPDAIICGVGTEIHDLTTGELVAGWPEIAFDWSPELIRSVCDEYDELEEQPREFLSNFKLSYFGCSLSETFLQQLSRHLEAVGQEASLIYSSNRDLDILPAATNKGTAATYLARHWGFDRERVIVAGDSGNDLEMFRAGFRGIVVGNAQPELRRLHADNVYHAQAECAAGVLEGLQHWLEKFSNESLGTRL
ncbi:MAG: HAD-IIB family hydrolase [Pirellulales bacterium]